MANYIPIGLGGKIDIKNNIRSLAENGCLIYRGNVGKLKMIDAEL
ncbi:hypothetical protein [Enterococcus haemoperoxidus]|nr:hypothetical protein [Enterococcus haemoperoxidus]OJG54560.1 hypothetical protein RV06_GL002903 [Enterococcus haemoperoxidus]